MSWLVWEAADNYRSHSTGFFFFYYYYVGENKSLHLRYSQLFTCSWRRQEPVMNKIFLRVT